MRWEILQKPDFSMLRVGFDQPGEEIRAEGSTMVAKDSAVQMTTSMSGGFLAAAKRKLLGGESLFQNTFTATGPGQRVWLAPGPEGDLDSHVVDGYTPLMMSSGAFVASVPSVQLDTQWGGAKGFFSGAGLFLLRASGQGPVFFASYGGVHPIDIGPMGYVCDTSHIVAFTGGLQYQVRKVGGIKSLFFSGEGLVCEFRGQGRLWISTRSPAGLVSFLHPFRRVESRG
jgi:uncharacterized protein (TIGR00266 family)